MHLDLGTLFTGGAGAILLSAAARALPEPVPSGNFFYQWLYRFAHLLLANFDKVESHSDHQQSGN